MTQPSSVFTLAIFGQMLLTIGVSVALLNFRVGVHLSKKVSPQAVADEDRAKVLYKDGINLSDNLENLFEMPVLFYAIALLVLVRAQSPGGPAVDWGDAALAWGFVILRVFHTVIHTTTNRVYRRFQVFVASSLTLWALIFKAAFAAVRLFV